MTILGVQLDGLLSAARDVPGAEIGDFTLRSSH
jgi:hypothetical protein